MDKTVEIIVRSTDGEVLGRALGTYTPDAKGFAHCRFPKGLTFTASGMYGSAALVIGGRERPANLTWNIQEVQAIAGAVAQIDCMLTPADQEGSR